jgi:hypothetical protein
MEFGPETIALISAVASAALYLLMVLFVVTGLVNFARPFIQGMRLPW